ncbi:MAG: hypothetical protein Q7T73_13105 [Beijerinckiaceae bacterium]|nr:hypothetical protein [Beijerinckiaceae bacterium]
MSVTQKITNRVLQAAGFVNPGSTATLQSIYVALKSAGLSDVADKMVAAFVVQNVNEKMFAEDRFTIEPSSALERAGHFRKCPHVRVHILQDMLIAMPCIPAKVDGPAEIGVGHWWIKDAAGQKFVVKVDGSPVHFVSFPGTDEVSTVQELLDVDAEFICKILEPA